MCYIHKAQDLIYNHLTNFYTTYAHKRAESKSLPNTEEIPISGIEDECFTKEDKTCFVSFLRGLTQ